MDKLTLEEARTWNISAETEMKAGSRDRNREIVRIRDNHTCQICGKVWKEGYRRFDVHHLDCDYTKSRKADNLDNEWDNMITVCHMCHLRLPEHRKTMSESMNRKKNKTVDNSDTK